MHRATTTRAQQCHNISSSSSSSSSSNCQESSHTLDVSRFDVVCPFESPKKQEVRREPEKNKNMHILLKISTTNVYIKTVYLLILIVYVPYIIFGHEGTHCLLQYYFQVKKYKKKGKRMKKTAKWSNTPSSQERGGNSATGPRYLGARNTRRTTNNPVR